MIRRLLGAIAYRLLSWSHLYREDCRRPARLQESFLDLERRIPSIVRAELARRYERGESIDPELLKQALREVYAFRDRIARLQGIQGDGAPRWLQELEDRKDKTTSIYGKPDPDIAPYLEGPGGVGSPAAEDRLTPASKKRVAALSGVEGGPIDSARSPGARCKLCGGLMLPGETVYRASYELYPRCLLCAQKAGLLALDPRDELLDQELRETTRGHTMVDEAYEMVRKQKQPPGRRRGKPPSRKE